MSCSTTSLLAGTITTKTLTIEDPYIFTETVPTTPPTLFSNSQKSRSRFESKPQIQQLQQQQQQSTGITAANVAANGAVNNNALKEKFYVKARNYVAQTQTPSIVAAAAATTNNFTKSAKAATQPQQQQQHVVNSQTAVLGVLNTNNLKKYETKTTKLPQQLSTTTTQRQQQKYAAQLAYAAQNENIIQKQQQQRQQQQQQQTKILSANPPPLLLSHTPSLWQTPLILESSGTIVPTASIKRGGAATIQQPQLTAATTLVTPLNTVAAATTLMISTAAVPLPPSNFHHTTLAQHLQKLQCLKKPKKTTTTITGTNAVAKITNNATATFVQPTPPPPITPQLPQKALNEAKQTVASSTQQPITQQQQQQQQQHSANDLNEIPVNVIYRAATTPTTTTLTSQNLTPTVATKAEKAPSKPLLAANCAKIPNQPATKPRKIKKGNTAAPAATKAAAANATAPLAHLSVVNTNKPLPKKRQANAPLLPHTAKAQKRFRKTSCFPSLLNENAALPDISLSTKAVAVVKRSFDELENDFDVENELPFCVQRHWFYKQQLSPPPPPPSLSEKVSSREARLTEYKNALRRQAMQLLATRSLQRLPFHVARKRLLCVDKLLRKYRDHNKCSLPSKQCEVECCKNAALVMTTVCQQHMAKNSKQSLFVMCSAKIIKTNNNNNNSAQMTTCNNPVLNIQKQYAPPLCYMHLSQQQQQQQKQQQLLLLPNNASNTKATESQINAPKRIQQTTTTTRKRKFAAVSATPAIAGITNTHTTIAEDTLQLVSRTQLQRKNSTTSLESIASNSQSSFGSVMKQTITTAAMPAMSTAASNMLSPPALAPLSYTNNNNSSSTTMQRHNSSATIAATSTIDPYAEQEINKLVAQFAMAAAAKSATSVNANNNNNIINNNNNFNSFNFMNTNSNSNLTSSGVGSSSSLPSTDELLTQDMFSNCENSSAYASSSEDTGLGELSESELMAVSSIADTIEANAIASVGGGVVGGGGAFNDDVSPDEIPLGDARLLEENDLVNVFGTLPVNINELFNAVVQQDEREEVERALEIADEHLRSLQQTIGTNTNFLDDLLNVDDDMLDVDTDDLPTNENLEVATLYFENAEKVLSNGGGGGGVGVGVMSGMHSSNNLHPLATNITMPSNCAVVNNGANSAGVMDIRGLLQT